VKFEKKGIGLGVKIRNGAFGLIPKGLEWSAKIGPNPLFRATFGGFLRSSKEEK
jgi:hypothetical protein